MKQIEDFPDYFIDENGDVWSNKSNKWKKVKPTLTNKGYLTYRACNNGIRKHISIHRAVALTYVPNPNNLPQVNHIDGNKLNNNVNNLEWTTNQKNRNHAVKNGLHAKGEQIKNSKLTEQQVIEIRKKYIPKKYTMSKLAKEYGVRETAIYRIINYKRWKHI